MTITGAQFSGENNQSPLINDTRERTMIKQAVEISLTDRNVMEMSVAVRNLGLLQKIKGLFIWAR